MKRERFPSRNGPQALDKERRKRLFDIHGQKDDVFPAWTEPAYRQAGSVGTGASRGFVSK